MINKDFRRRMLCSSREKEYVFSVNITEVYVDAAQQTYDITVTSTEDSVNCGWSVANTSGNFYSASKKSQAVLRLSFNANEDLSSNREGTVVIQQTNSLNQISINVYQEADYAYYSYTYSNISWDGSSYNINYIEREGTEFTASVYTNISTFRSLSEMKLTSAAYYTDHVYMTFNSFSADRNTYYCTTSGRYDLVSSENVVSVQDSSPSFGYVGLSLGTWRFQGTADGKWWLVNNNSNYLATPTTSVYVRDFSESINISVPPFSCPTGNDGTSNYNTTGQTCTYINSWGIKVDVTMNRMYPNSTNDSLFRPTVKIYL